MATIVLTSASGSPGVTTCAVGLALAWPRPVLLVEADPTGGSGIHAGYLRGEIDPDAGLIDLALAHRQGRLAEALPQTVRAWPGTPVGLLSGIRSRDQARSLVGLWEPLIPVLSGLHRNGQDVIIDAGRLGLAGWPAPLVMSADLTLLVIRNTLPSIAAARSWSTSLGASFANAGGESRFGLLMIEESGRWSAKPGQVQTYSPRQTAKTLQTSVVTTLPWHASHAACFSHGATPPRRWHTSPLARGIQAAVGAIGQRLETNAAGLHSGLEPTGTDAGGYR